jgi:putative phosphoribosyl transferase
MLFHDRYDAGRKLAVRLGHHADDKNVIVVALPRGGVPVGFEVAKVLKASLDVFLVRKLGVPGQEELAMGAIASNGVRVFNYYTIRMLAIPVAEIARIEKEARQELDRREKLYRGDSTPLEVRGKTVILVDDGLATGSSMRAAVTAIRKLKPSRLVVAVPVGTAEACKRFEEEVDEMVCAHEPEPFRAVGEWYDDFSQTTDEEVRELLKEKTVHDNNHTRGRRGSSV